MKSKEKNNGDSKLDGLFDGKTKTFLLTLKLVFVHLLHTESSTLFGIFSRFIDLIFKLVLK